MFICHLFLIVDFQKMLTFVKTNFLLKMELLKFVQYIELMSRPNRSNQYICTCTSLHGIFVYDAGLCCVRQDCQVERDAK